MSSSSRCASAGVPTVDRLGTLVCADESEPSALIDVLAPDADVALAAAQLEDAFAGDPADRLIYSAARRAGAALISCDARITEFDRERVIW